MSWTRTITLGVALAIAWPGVAPAAPSKGVRQVSIDAATVDGLEVELSARCRDQVRDELRQGQRRDDACRADREAIGRAAVRARDAFGFVERRVVELASLRLTLGLARRCHQWPLRHPDRDVLRRTDVDQARCRLRRYEGPLPLTFVDREGRRHQPLDPAVTDRDGRVTLRFAALDHALRSRGAGSLDDYAHIELGRGAWAGRVDLDQLLRFRADWYLTWVTAGRGTPGLFAVRHPEHEGTADAQAMAAGARLTRQLESYERVRAGELPARAYFDWFVQSPYHRQLRAWLRTRRAEASTDQPPQERSAPANSR